MLTRVLNPGPLQVERLPDGRRKLLRCLRVDVSRKRDGTKTEVVSAGFCMDYSSIPWGLRWLVNWSRVDIAGVVHDHIYGAPGNFTWRTRLEADLVWFRLARSGRHRANWLQAALGFAGLYLGACWVPPARSKCTKWHKAAVGTCVLVVLLLFACVLGRCQLWQWPLGELWHLRVACCVARLAVFPGVPIAVLVAVNWFQSTARSRSFQENPNAPKPANPREPRTGQCGPRRTHIRSATSDTPTNTGSSNTEPRDSASTER